MLPDKNIVSDRRVRESNFELLRLVCMFFILLHHFIYHVLGYSNESILVSFNSLFIIAVNCFVLISGFFGIRISWRGFFHLYIICVFYNLLFSLLQAGYTDVYSLKSIFRAFLPFSHSEGIWFITCYFYLFLLSPMLNKVVDNCNKSEFIALLIIWSVITFYFGYLWQKDVNYNGYNVMNFIFLYFIGRFIAMHTLNITTTKRQFLYLGIYILCSVISAVFIITKSSDIHSITNRFYIYNSPVVFISAISFFLFFRTLKFKNRFINWIAKSALAVYLIHENRFVKEHLYGYIKESIAGIDTEWMLAVRLLFYGVVVFAACIVIDNVRFVITNPVEKFINKIKWDLYTRQFISYIAKLIK